METRPRRVAVVGAGASGIVTARAMRDAGHHVVVLEALPELGGVWSSARDYPGLATQNDKPSYSFSDLEMPAEWPDQPTSAHMREYLRRYAVQHDLLQLIRFETVVVHADPEADGSWRVRTEHHGETGSERFDVVVVTSGALSDPVEPDWPGRDEFERAGGRVALPGDLRVEPHRGGRTVVVGWGKTACDLAVALQPMSASLTVVARSLRWKTPQRIGRMRIHELLMLTRSGEWLLYGRQRLRSRIVHKASRIAPHLLRAGMSLIIDRHLGLSSLGLRPSGGLTNASSQVTPGLYEAIREGRIVVRRDQQVVRLAAHSGPVAVLDDGVKLPADDIVLGTGYRIRFPFLPDDVVSRLVDESGGLALHRFALPVGVRGLYFVGWTGNISGLLTAEIVALWVAAHSRGRIGSGAGPSARGNGNRDGRPEILSIPGSDLPDLDLLLQDLGHPLPRRLRVEQWFRTLRADHYASALAAVRRDLRLGPVDAATDGGGRRGDVSSG